MSKTVSESVSEGEGDFRDAMYLKKDRCGLELECEIASWEKLKNILPLVTSSLKRAKCWSTVFVSKYRY